MVEDTQPALVVLDPLQSFMGGKVNMNQQNETRAVLEPLLGLASEFGFALVIICHPPKSRYESAVNVVAGSIDLAAAARSILYIDKDPDCADRRVITHNKHSLTKSGTTLLYRIVGVGSTAETEVPRVVWEGSSNLTYNDLAREPSGARQTAKGTAIEFLRSALAKGPVASKELFARGEQVGHASSTLYRAKTELNIRARKDGHGGWSWELPEYRDQQGDQLPFSEEANATDRRAAYAGQRDQASTRENLDYLGDVAKDEHDQVGQDDQVGLVATNLQRAHGHRTAGARIRL
jgi:hypothetical protein